VHIRRTHAGVGQPIGIGDSSHGGRALLSDPNWTRTTRRSSPIPFESINRLSVHYPSISIGKDCGDIIDGVHRFLTQIEENRRKMDEIMEINSRHNSSAVPRWISSAKFGNFIENAMETRTPDVSYQKKLDLDPPARKYSGANVATSSNEAIEKSPHYSFPGHDTDKKQQPSPSAHLVCSKGDVSDEDASPNVRWVFKYDAYGHVIDAHKVVKDLIQELRDSDKEEEKRIALMEKLRMKSHSINGNGRSSKGSTRSLVKRV